MISLKCIIVLKYCTKPHKHNQVLHVKHFTKLNKMFKSLCVRNSALFDAFISFLSGGAFPSFCLPCCPGPFINKLFCVKKKKEKKKWLVGIKHFSDPMPLSKLNFKIPYSFHVLNKYECNHHFQEDVMYTVIGFWNLWNLRKFLRKCQICWPVWNPKVTITF